MKRIAIVLILLAVVTGCATRPTGENPFATLDPTQVAKITVGDLSVNPETEESTFSVYFEITDQHIVRRLVELATNSKHQIDGWPGIGMLSYQRFLDPDGRVLADTCIVNFDNTVVIHEPEIPIDGYWKCMKSKEFCRTIYDLMLRHVPEEIESLRKGYREVGQELEALLFEGRQVKRTAQQAESTVASEAAPSASSDVR